MREGFESGDIDQVARGLIFHSLVRYVIPDTTILRVLPDQQIGYAAFRSAHENLRHVEQYAVVPTIALEFSGDVGGGGREFPPRDIHGPAAQLWRGDAVRRTVNIPVQQVLVS